MTPKHPSWCLTLVLCLTFLAYFPKPTFSNPCLSGSSSLSSCPPLSFPFSTSLGCGHPLFHLTCSSKHLLISINNITFILVHKHSHSLLLSSPHNLTHHSLNLSHSPFHLTYKTCLQLSQLPHFCPNLTNCPIPRKPTSTVTDCSSPASALLPIPPSGIEVEWDSTDHYFIECGKCQAYHDGFCGYDAADREKQFVCFGSHREIEGRIALYSILFSIACFSLIFAIGFTIFRCRCRCRGSNGRGEEDPTAVFLHRHRSSHLLPPVFTYEELEIATNGFDLKRKIGDGGFGSVYLAQLGHGQIVAVKKLHKRHAAATASKSFCNEVLILSSISHPNLVKLHGYCSDPRGLILVYDYVPNGTLADHLHGSKSVFRRGSLSWPVRVEVALQTAMAIEYLHFSVHPPIVHRDITSSNIFVEKDMKVKLGDFGLSRLLVFTEASATYVWTGPQGTPGYLDPDYHRSFQLTEKSDVYSFGVVLFELISGLKAVDLRRDKREVALADLMVGKIHLGEQHQVFDPVLKEEAVVDTISAVAELAFRCVAVDKDDRPDSREAVTELRRIRSRLHGDCAPETCKS